MKRLSSGSKTHRASVTLTRPGSMPTSPSSGLTKDGTLLNRRLLTTYDTTLYHQVRKSILLRNRPRYYGISSALLVYPERLSSTHLPARGVLLLPLHSSDVALLESKRKRSSTERPLIVSLRPS